MKRNHSVFLICVLIAVVAINCSKTVELSDIISNEKLSETEIETKLDSLSISKLSDTEEIRKVLDNLLERDIMEKRILGKTIRVGSIVTNQNYITIRYSPEIFYVVLQRKTGFLNSQRESIKLWTNEKIL